MITIQSDRLTVSMAEPGKELRTCRFNRTGFITSVLLDGVHEFADSERGGSGGYGLCSEISTDVCSADVAVGEQFPKFGVGTLEKTEDRPYFFMNSYPTEDFDVQFTAGESEVSFVTAPRICQGFALSEKKKVSVQGNMLRVDYEVTNAGEKPFHYLEYVHNFLAMEIDGKKEGFQITMPNKNHPFPFEWKITFFPADRAIYMKDYFEPEYYNIWSPGFVVSPEIFAGQDLQPGETFTYAREWIFE